MKLGMNMSLRLSVAVIALLIPRITCAQVIEVLPGWTSTASSCSLDPASAAMSAFSNADFKFSGTNVGGGTAIVVRCNVTNPLDTGNPTWNTLFVGYQDPDGVGTKYRALARLR